jgi:MoxR-like ATPase
VDKTIRDYIVQIVIATRNHPELILGASPRGSHGLYRSIQAYAAINGRDYVLPDDVKRLATAVIAHRCIVHPESALRGVTVDGVLAEVLESTTLDIGELA